MREKLISHTRYRIELASRGVAPGYSTSPFQGFSYCLFLFPGRWPELSYYAPSGLTAQAIRLFYPESIFLRLFEANR